MEGRIYLNTDLFPDGHELTKFDWTARLMPGAGIYFDFDIQSEKYCKDYDCNLDDEEPELWESKGMWAISGSCWISSTTEWATGFLIGSSENKLPFEQLNFERYQADPIDGYWENEDRCFEAHILDHDYVGGHTIEMQKQESGLFSIKWTGKVALLNWGNFEFDNSFLVQAEAVQFAGIRFPANLSVEEATEELKNYVVDVDRFKIVNFQKDTRFFPEPRFVPL